MTLQGAILLTYLLSDTQLKNLRRTLVGRWILCKLYLITSLSLRNSIITLFSITPAYFVRKILRCDSVADVDHAWEGKGHEVLICSTFLQLGWLQFDISGNPNTLLGKMHFNCEADVEEAWEGEGRWWPGQEKSRCDHS